MSERVGWRQCVEKNGDSAVWRGRFERIRRQHVGELRARSHRDADRLARIRFETLFELVLHRSLGQLAVEHDITARDIRAHVSETNGLAHRAQFGHGKLAGASDIHGAQKSDISNHVSSLIEWGSLCSSSFK